MIRPAGKLFFGVLAAGATALAILVAIGAWLLSTGPISLTFLTPYIEDALRQVDSDVAVEFDDIVLTWAGWERTLDVRVVGVRMLAPGGELVASLPTVSVGLSGRALLSGRMALTSVEMSGVEAGFVRRADGVIDFGPGERRDDESGVGDEVLAELLRPPDPSRPLGYLRRLTIRDAELRLYDERSGAAWRAPRVSAVLTRDLVGIRGDAELDLELDGAVEHFFTKVNYVGAARQTRVNLRFSDIEPGRLGAAHDGFARFDALRVPISGSVDFVLGRDGAISDVSFALEGGAGELALPALYDRPQPLAHVVARGHLDDDFEVADLDVLSFDLMGPKLTLSGRAWIGGEGHGLLAEGGLDRLTVAELKQLWPEEVAARARDWVIGHLHDGVIGQATFRVIAPPGAAVGGALPDEAVAVDFSLEGVSASYFRDFPPVSEGSGRAHLTGGRLDISGAAGQLGGLEFSDGTFSVTGLNGPDQHVQIDIVATGAISDAMTLLDREPFGFARAVGLDPKLLEGVAATRLRIRLPAKRGLERSEIEVSAAANLKDAAVPKLYGAYDLSRGELGLRADGRGVALNGRAALNGVPLEIAWERRFGAAREFRLRYTLSGVLDDAARAALLVPAGGYATGSVPVELEVVVDDEGVLRAAGEADLTMAKVVVPALHWEKEPGSDGFFKISLRKSSDGAIAFESLTLAGPDLTATGDAEFDADWGLRRLDLGRLAVGGADGTRLAASLRPRDGGGFTVELAGEQLDLRPFLDDSDDDSGTLPPLDVSAEVARVIVDDEQRLSNVKGSATHADGTWRALAVEATLNGDAPLVLSLVPRENRRELTLTSADAGAVARALDFFPGLQGGRLSATAVIRDQEPGRPVAGEVFIEEFRVVEAPVLARILTIGSLRGIGDLLNGEGIRFVRFAAPFTLADDKVTLEEARAYGPALGITVEGVIDRAADTADLRGTIVPAYTINSMFGKIPLLGDILVGKEGEGVFALTYSVKGKTEDPVVVVNPLSALVPGILRRMLFLGPEGEGPLLPEDYESPK